MQLYRLSYLPDSESEDFPPEILAQLNQLESILEKVPQEQQLDFIKSLVTQAQMLHTAARRWRVEQEEQE